MKSRARYAPCFSLLCSLRHKSTVKTYQYLRLAFFLRLSYDIIPLRLVMVMMQKGAGEDWRITIDQAGMIDIPAIAAVFTASFEESVRDRKSVV